MPDPYIFAVALTVLTAVLALAIAPHHAVGEILSAWYKGIFDIFAFALEMILVLVTGFALAASGAVTRALAAIASVPRTPKAAVTLTFLVSAAACWLNWGFGLVVAGVLARTIARRMRIDFGWLVASAYAGFVVWASGLSSSIALAQATPGSKLNIVQAFTGHVLSMRETIFTPFNLVPVAVLLVAVPLVLVALEPRTQDVATGNVGQLESGFASRDDARAAKPGTLAFALDHAWILNLVLVVAGIAYLANAWRTTGFALDINSVIFIFFLLGLLLHWTPAAYVNAVNAAARITGPLLVQYPLYGGIMGIMTTTGLAGVIAAWFLTFSTAASLPFWSYAAQHGYLAVRPQRRRPLGGPGTVRRTGRRKTRRLAGGDRDGRGHRRASGQHDSALLGAAGAGDRRRRAAAGNGVYGRRLLRCRGGLRRELAVARTALGTPCATTSP